MDTLMALRHAREQGSKVLAICNVNGSTIPRESDAVVYTYAGPEVAVASTKAFLTMIVAVHLVALYLAQVRGNKWGDEIRSHVHELADIPAAVDQVLDTVEPMRELARSLVNAKAVLFLGRHVGYPVALEGALKLKELAYMHAEGFPAGELKHGPIALIEEGVPVVVVVPPRASRQVLHDKIVSNIQEIRARGAQTIVIAEEGDEAVRPYADTLISVPAVPTLLQPLVATVPLQVFACEIARAKGLTSTSPGTSRSRSRSSKPPYQASAMYSMRSPSCHPLPSRFLSYAAHDSDALEIRTSRSNESLSCCLRRGRW